MTNIIEPLAATGAFVVLCAILFLAVYLAVAGLREVASPACPCVECRCCGGCP